MPQKKTSTHTHTYAVKFIEARICLEIKSVREIHCNFWENSPASIQSECENSRTSAPYA